MSMFSYARYATDTQALNPQMVLGEKKHTRTCSVRGHLGRFYIVRKAKHNSRVENIHSGESLRVSNGDLCLMVDSHLWCNDDSDFGEVPACSEITENEPSEVTASPVPDRTPLEAPFHLYPRVRAEISQAVVGASLGQLPKIVTPILKKYFPNVEAPRLHGNGYYWDFDYYHQGNLAYVDQDQDGWMVDLEGEPSE